MTSSRYNEILNIPLARPLAILRPAPGGSGDKLGSVPVPLAPGLALGHASRRRRPGWVRAAGLLLGLAMGESLARSWPSRPGSPKWPDSPGTRETEILGQLALRGAVTPGRLARALAEDRRHADQPSFQPQGVHWRQRRSDQDEAMPATRSTVLALVPFRDDTELLREAAAAALTTHSDIRVAAAAVMAPWAATEALRMHGSAKPDLPGTLQRLALRCRSVERILVRRAASWLAPSWPDHQHLVSDALYRAAELTGAPTAQVLDSMRQQPDGNVSPSLDSAEVAVPVAILLAFSEKSSFVETVEPLVEHSRGSPGLCALTGALLGSRLGLGGLPGRGSGLLAQRQRLVALARAMVGCPASEPGLGAGLAF